MTEIRFLTMKEASIKLRCDERTIRRMLQNGTLTGAKLPHGEWRIADPGQRFEQYLRELDHHLVHVPLLNVREVAEITGQSLNVIYKAVARKKLVLTSREGKRSEMYFTISEVRRYLQGRQKLPRPARASVRIQELVDLSRDLLRTDKTAPEHAATRDKVEELVDRIMLQPEPQRTASMQELFRKVDKTSLIIEAALSPTRPRLCRRATPR